MSANKIMKITITIEDEDYIRKAETGSFEIAEQELDQLNRNYQRHLTEYLDKADVMAESLKEEV